MPALESVKQCAASFIPRFIKVHLETTASDSVKKCYTSFPQVDALVQGGERTCTGHFH
ncbi:hypothetical protein DPMN_180288 [Dreissena polymorpha]|uniref:Uncharacterized protein n=1 Tax=Dreissena polymorpha TaxID=45954 RepID=A0A9D4EFL7_DREPO|nr:hypothetical protein DPMN_180288 [Dreissena polymorpha]